MVLINGGVVDLEKLEVEDIINVSTLQNFLDNFAIGITVQLYLLIGKVRK